MDLYCGGAADAEAVRSQKRAIGRQVGLRTVCAGGEGGEGDFGSGAQGSGLERLGVVIWLRILIGRTA